MRTSGVSDTLCMLIAGKWVLCLVQCVVMSVHGVLAMCLAALLCWLMQGHGPQMQHLQYNTWQACLGQMTLNIKYSGATADTGIPYAVMAHSVWQCKRDLMSCTCCDLFFMTATFHVSCVQYVLSSCIWICICCMRKFSSGALTFAAIPSGAHSVGFVKYRSDQ